MTTLIGGDRLKSSATTRPLTAADCQLQNNNKPDSPDCCISELKKRGRYGAFAGTLGDIARTERDWWVLDYVKARGIG